MKPIRRLYYILRLFSAFLVDLVLSSLQVARATLAPRDITRPRFITVPLAQATSDIEITLVANYITLTPGTLTVDVSPDRKTLLVHSLFAGRSGDGVREDVRDAIEPRVIRATRT